MATVGLEHFLTVAAALFVMGGGLIWQNVLARIYRVPAKAMVLRDVKPGQGL